MNAVLLTDIDNTLYNWIDYFAPCFRAMVHSLAFATKIDEDEIYRQFRDVYIRFETAEYRHAIQELQLYRDASGVVREKLLQAGFVAFSRARIGRLAPYESVVPTLKWVRRQGIPIVAVTNSWIRDAMGRLHKLGLIRLIDGIVAWDGNQPIGGQPIELGMRGVPGRVVLVPSHGRKPSSFGYIEAINSFRTEATSSIWVIGDSLANDLAPAVELGATTIWARYGHQFEQVNYDTIVRITHWDADRIRSTYETKTHSPDKVVDDFAELRNILPSIENSLFPDWIE